MKLGLIFLLVFCAGCSLVTIPAGQSSAPVTNTVAVPVHDHVPVLPVPVKPKQEELTQDELAEFGKLSPALQKKLVANDSVIKTYAEQLAEGIKIYNNYATLKNQEAQAAIDSLGKER